MSRPRECRPRPTVNWSTTRNFYPRPLRGPARSGVADLDTRYSRRARCRDAIFKRDEEERRLIARDASRASFSRIIGMIRGRYFPALGIPCDALLSLLPLEVRERERERERERDGSLTIMLRYVH